MEPVFSKKIYKNNFLKRKVFNPHTFWNHILILFIILLTLELFIFSWYFLFISQKLDAPAIVKLETNKDKIELMSRTLDKIDKTINERVIDQITPN